jgi:hypothetical protein
MLAKLTSKNQLAELKMSEADVRKAVEWARGRGR